MYAVTFWKSEVEKTMPDYLDTLEYAWEYAREVLDSAENARFGRYDYACIYEEESDYWERVD